MFTYDVMCMLCGKQKVYEVSFKEEPAADRIKKSGGVCAKCAPAYKAALETGTKLYPAKGPFYIRKMSE